jgi:hypothetical protein
METRLPENLRVWLAEVGIRTLPELAKVGPGPAYMEIKTRHPLEAGLPLLWSLAGCVLGLPAENIPHAVRQDLLDEIL